MGRYKLTKAADQDFEDIFDFGIDKFGLTQALNDQNGMSQRFGELAEQPKLYLTRPLIISAKTTVAVSTTIHIRFITG